MDLRSRLTYANVAATLALFLAVAGGTVYAASEIGRNDVKSKNIAKGAVKTSDLAGQAVTGVKVKDGTITSGDIGEGTITGADIAAGVIPNIRADVTGTAMSGERTDINTNTTTPLALTGTTSFTPGEGEVAAIAAEGLFTIATTNVANNCSPDVFLLVNGQPTRIFVSPNVAANPTTLTAATGYDADGPFGLVNPGTPIEITAQIRGDVDCAAGSRLDRLEVRIIQLK